MLFQLSVMNLYLDLGASHIKVLYEDTVQVFEYLTKEKVNVKDFSNFVKNILNSYTFSKLYVCSQMHGFHIEGTPDYISWMCEDVEHETLECGTGFYDMKRRCQKDTRFKLPTVVRDGPTVCGKVGGSEVYAPLGDLQSAVMGIDQDLEIGDVIINMGTGSQVIQIGRTYRDDTENRPLFDYTLNCLTHIPSGRSMKFFKDLFNLPDYSDLKLDDVIGSKENFNLGFFKSAYGFDGHGALTNIHEHTTKYTIACSFVRCYVQQYVKILNDTFNKRSRIFLTGGIAKNIPIIKTIFEHYLGETVNVEDNDTLKGLYKYSKYDDTCFWFNG